MFFGHARKEKISEGKKYFVLSVDDGLEQDKKIIELLRFYNMGATFHLNSGLYGRCVRLEHRGNICLREVEIGHEKQSRWLQYENHFRIQENEVQSVYEGFEIASHSLHHKTLTKCSEEEIHREISEDIKRLSAQFDCLVHGFSYPVAAVDERIKNELRVCGIQYARCSRNAKTFRFPRDLLEMCVTARLADVMLMPKLKRFLAADAKKQDLLFLMAGHGYEPDYGTRRSSWERLEKICRMVSGRQDVCCCGLGQAVGEHLKKCEKQEDFPTLYIRE